ncbi:V-type ATPase subunit [Treponema sp.]|uniref:V0D/AC39 family V-type ATPase subunit n=1 Tax=Treponema sp. TaxID=166 RepID=UPI00298E0A59|nr:V-type ATPase subunit [Treponema sp.]MCR5613630.1 V-type ATPase subunit [Treponema sp.]
MDRTGASCYIYAKASGMLAKSYTGPNAKKLFNAKSLQELWSLLFDDEMPSVPQTVLAQVIEKKSYEKFVEEYNTLLTAYSKPDDVLVELLHWFDFENLKNAGALLSTGHSEKLDYTSIKPFNLLKYEQWPDLEKMTVGTELAWYNRPPQVFEQQEFSNRLDIQFIKKIWKVSEKLPAAEKKAVQKIIAERYSMKNILWAMRLKVYYNMSSDEIKNRLVFLEDRKSRSDLFAKEALKILDFNVDSYDDWSKWHYAFLLNSSDDLRFWKLDPQFVEQKVSDLFYVQMKRNFHREPFTAMVMVAWFFIKMHELDNIRMVTEAIRLNVDIEERGIDG